VANERPTSRLEFAVGGPQPFGDRTSLRLELPAAATISIEVFDVQGRRVGDRVAGRFAPGHHELPLDAARLASGVYFARLTAGGRSQAIRLVHVR